MKPEPLSVVFSAPLAVDEALETVVRALQSEGFAIVSKLDIHPKTQSVLAGQTNRATLLRACYPKENCARYFMSQREPRIVRCSVLLQQSDSHCTVEVARPTRLLDMEHEETHALVAETDWKLKKMIAQLMKDIEDARSQSGRGAVVAAAFGERKGNP